MVKKAVVIALAVFAAATLALALYARSVLSSDNVRRTLEEQLTTQLGRPVRIGSAGASIYPRVSLQLRNVTVGESDARLDRVSVSTGLRGLFSRRIEDAEVVAADGRLAVDAALAMAGAARPTTSTPDASPAVTLVSIRTIALDNVDVAAGASTFSINLRSSLAGDRLAVSRLSAKSARTQLEGSGEVNTHTGEMRFDITANPLDLDELLALASTFSSSNTTARGNAGTSSPVSLQLAVKAPRGTFAGYDFTDCTAQVKASGSSVNLPELSFKIFGGQFAGALNLDVSGATPRMQLRGKADGIDVTQLAAAAGKAGSISGQLAADINVTTAGADMDAMLRAAQGTADVAITNGAIPGLEMVRTIVLAFGKPSGAPPEGSGSAFTRLAGTFDIRNGTLTSNNLTFASRDFDMSGRVSLHVVSGAIDAATNVVLSKELTAQAGTDLRRVAQSDGRVIVPARISGTLANPTVSIDLAAATQRALENELKRRAKGLFDDLFKKKKGGGGV